MPPEPTTGNAGTSNLGFETLNLIEIPRVASVRQLDDLLDGHVEHVLAAIRSS